LQDGLVDDLCWQREILCQDDFLRSKYHGLLFNQYKTLVLLVQMLYSMETTVSMKCRLISLFLRRHCIRKHDFWQQFHNLTTRKATFGISWGILRLSWAFYHCIPLSWNWKWSNRVTIFPGDKPTEYIGGGSSTFSLDDLQPYFINETISTTATTFTFKDYLLQTELEDLEDFVACDIPIHLMSTKLPIKDLRHIASCHGIDSHSKIRLVEIQNLICNHMCDACELYAAVFEPVDDQKKIERRQSTNLKAVKR
jgi:hypothetical protein